MKEQKFGDYKSILTQKGVLAFVPHGNSMWPFYKNGKQTVVIKNKTERLNLFDVAFYLRKDGTYVLHRVIEVKENGYIMRGDSQIQQEFVLENCVLGVVDGFYKGKKYILARDEKHLKKVKKWYKNGFFTTQKKRIFHFIQRKKASLKNN